MAATGAPPTPRTSQAAATPHATGDSAGVRAPDPLAAGAPGSGGRTRVSTARFDPRTPNVARIYDYLLDGKDNFPADRATAHQLLELLPDAAKSARDNRKFVMRVVRHLAAEAGIRQFIDIGTGLPTRDSIHEVAQSVAEDSRVVYSDYDPVVVTHARALLATTPSEAAIAGDLRFPAEIRADPELRQLIDFRKPVALLLTAVLHHIRDDEHPYDMVRTLTDALPAGSFVAISHITADEVPDDVAAAAQDLYALASAPANPRTRGEITRFFDGMELIDPGIVATRDWRPPARGDKLPRALAYGGVGYKHQ
jgi:S-adenosyl methyltransferase